MMRTLLLTCRLCALSPAQVQYQDIVKGPGEDWLTYAGSYQGWRYSPLKQITVENAGSMLRRSGFTMCRTPADCVRRRSFIRA